jgi:hypothetical protein
VTFFNTWIVPALLLCLMVLWLWMEIRDKIRREDAEARHDSALRVLNRQIRVLELRCDALSKRADPHKPLSFNFTCPMCDSHHWVKDSYGGRDCHGYVAGGKRHCGFTWNEVDDWLWYEEE